MIALQASLHSTPYETWLGPGMYGFCVPHAVGEAHTASDAIADAAEGASMEEAMEEAARSLGGGPLAGCREMGLGSWYLAAFAWSTMVITG